MVFRLLWLNQLIIFKTLYRLKGWVVMNPMGCGVWQGHRKSRRLLEACRASWECRSQSSCVPLLGCSWRSKELRFTLGLRRWEGHQGPHEQTWFEEETVHRGSEASKNFCRIWGPRVVCQSSGDGHWWKLRGMRANSLPPRGSLLCWRINCVPAAWSSYP